MRLFVLFLVCSIGLSYASDGYAQKAVISIKVYDQRVGDILEEIEDQTDFDFFFNNKHVDLDRRVSVSADESNIFSVLKEVFAGTGVDYSVLDKKIILTVDSQSPQQEKTVTVSGVIVDETGEPLIGANIREEGATSNGTISDLNGHFNLTVSSNNAVLGITFIGYQAQTVKAVVGQQMKIVLKEDSQILDELVVVGYGVQKKRDLTGAVSSVRMSDEPVNTFSTISHALAGKAAGLQVKMNSSQPGASSTFRIRGETSINAGNSPLIVIDGFPISARDNLGSGNIYDNGSTDNVLESLNPNDIESIEVLKDASATSIYGSRAGNGVIIITTKRGNKGEKTKVKYSGNVSMQVMQKNYKMLNGPDMMRVRNANEYERYLYLNAKDIYANYHTAPAEEIPLAVPYSDQQIAAAQTTNWLDEVTRNGIQHSHNISLSGGSEKNQYMASVNYFSQEGIIKENSMQRFTANLNSDYEISQYVKTGISLNISRNTYDNVALGESSNEYAGVINSALRFAPFTPVYDENGDFSVNPFLPTIPNPVALLGITDKTAKDRLLGSGYIQVTPIKDLIFRMNLGIDRGFQKRKQYVPTTVPYGKQRDGRADINESNYTDYMSNLTVNYLKTIGNHSINALVGYEWQQFNSESLYAGNEKFPIDGFLYNNLNAGTYAKPSVGSGASKKTMASWFGRINYNYLGRYLLTATVRADGNSDFMPKERWGYFPSVSAAWRFSDEEFMKSASSWLSNGKLRASFGQTGNSDIGYYVTNAYGPKGSFIYNNSYYGGIAMKRLGNPNLTWETTTEWNFGLDLGFFNGRFNATVEYYHRVVSDLLVKEKKLMSYLDPNTIAANVGKTQGEGIEVTLSSVNIKNRDLVWTTDLTLYHYKDRWKERAEDWTASYNAQSQTDYIRSIFAYQTNGLLQVGQQAPAWQPGLLPGQVIIVNREDAEGAPDKITQMHDYRLLGSRDPKLSFGFNNTVRWKDFDLNVYCYGEFGRWRAGSYYESWSSGFLGDINNMSTLTKEAWSHDNQSSYVPSVLQNQTYSGTTDYWYKKVNFLRCRNITLGYSLKLPKYSISNIRIYADVNNPFVLSNWNGIDPETDLKNDGGSNNFAYPSIRSFSLGVDITF